MKIAKEFLVEREGKTFVLYQGLLDMAHQAGLRQITTALVQIPNEVNGHTAIVQATVELLDADTGRVREFQGIGDASPANTNRMMAPHAIRLAETRAKARALRDAVNVGMAAFEELALDDDAGVVAPPPARGPAARPAAPTADSDRHARAKERYIELTREAIALGIDYLPLKQLPQLDALVIAGVALKGRLDAAKTAQAAAMPKEASPA